MVESGKVSEGESEGVVEWRTHHIYYCFRSRDGALDGE